MCKKIHNFPMQVFHQEMIGKEEYWEIAIIATEIQRNFKKMYFFFSKGYYIPYKNQKP